MGKIHDSKVVALWSTTCQFLDGQDTLVKWLPCGQLHVDWTGTIHSKVVVDNVEATVHSNDYFMLLCL
jgi:hypothetical protein